ncbi:MAG TPA: DUF4838 domain-containing protein [Pirellulales bacterium]|nr:DUF4838 domain-containing protein [Pirellulales bacterium]
MALRPLAAEPLVHSLCKPDYNAEIHARRATAGALLKFPCRSIHTGNTSFQLEPHLVRTALSTASLILLIAVRAFSAEIPLVVEGRPKAVIVIADKPSAVAQYAAEELAIHLEKASGVRLAIKSESDAAPVAEYRVLVGDSRAARAAGVDFGKLPAEGFVLRTVNHMLVIAGDDGHGDPLDMNTRAGTLWGVYQCLEQALEVRWLWPGELGTYVPKNRSAVVHVADAEMAPHFFQRRLRPGLGFTSDHPALGFTAKAFDEFSHEQAVYLRRHRMGRSYPLGNHHAFEDWWKRYGQEHPDWFQLREDGQRGPAKPRSHYSMCVSNPGLQRQIVANWQASREAGSTAPSFVNACENDTLGRCSCAACQAWDGPQSADYLRFYSPDSKMAGSRFVSDRYARFWLAIQQLAAEKDPSATVVGYVYFNYFQAPTSGVRLNPQILLGYCPTGGWFPRSAEEDAWMKAQWTGWRNTGARLFMRTNHLLDGYCMPYIFAHQFADDFQHAFREGMVATDFDSLTGHWATQGPNLYLAARLHVCPTAAADDLLAEYYAAFGPAASAVKDYFDYWENYTSANRERINQAMHDQQASRWRSWARAAHVAYPEECFAPADTILARAAQVAAGNSEAAARVEFLRTGLSHARLCARAAGQLTLGTPHAASGEARQSLDELLAFRRAHEQAGISNFNHLAWIESMSWKLPDDTRQPPDTGSRRQP